MNALVRVAEGRVVADSRDVAQEFGKRHDSVLRSIDSMLKEQDDLNHTFVVEAYAVATGDGGKRMARRFDMDRKGFMLLVMGFQGAKALAIKSQWIDAFDAMERALFERQAPANDEAGTAFPPLAELTRGMAVAEGYRRLFGPDAGRWAVAMLGLPVPPGSMIATAPDGLALLADNVGQWAEACCSRVDGEKAASADLYRSYVQWCAEKQRIPETQTGFGRALTRMGVPPRKDRHGCMNRIGLRLID